MDKDEPLEDPFKALDLSLSIDTDFPAETYARLAEAFKNVKIVRREDWPLKPAIDLERVKIMAKTSAATMPKLDCLDEGWGWLEEASIRIGDPVFVGATPESSYYNWIWAWETTIGTKPHVIIRGHCNSRGEVTLWEVSAANNKVGMPDTGYQCARQPTSEEIIKLMDSAGLFALSAVPKEA